MRVLASGMKRAATKWVAAAVLLTLVGCGPVIQNHGYVPAEDDLARIEVGRDNRETVQAIVGRPSTAGLLNDEGWFYVQSRWRQFGPMAPQEIDRQVLSISFDKRGYVSNIERFGLEDGRVVALSRRVTDTNIAGVSVVDQLLGNLGVLNVGQFLNRAEQ